MTPTATPSSSFTDTPTFTYSPTITPTPVPEPFHVVMAIYNEAGERVKLLYEGPAQTVGTSVAVLPGSALGTIQLTGFTSAQGSVLTWSQDNDSGQAVGNGVYYAKLTSTDAFGSETSYTEAVTVLAQPDAGSIEVFSSAGERVRLIRLPAGLSPSDMDAVSATFVAGLDPVGGAPVDGLRLTVKGSSGTQQLVWDGLNDQGQPLASGTYMVSLSRSQAGSARTLKTLSVTLVSAVDDTLQACLAGAMVGPNPLKGDGPLSLAYRLPPRGTGVARLYALNGELVDSGDDLAGNGRIVLRANLAEGVYLMEFRIQEGAAILGRRVL
jgi:flagellar hook assembly protein FlgD